MEQVVLHNIDRNTGKISKSGEWVGVFEGGNGQKDADEEDDLSGSRHRLKFLSDKKILLLSGRNHSKAGLNHLYYLNI